MIGERCEYCIRRGDKLRRCSYKATQSIDIEGEIVYLCVWHASIVTKMLAKKARLEQQYRKTMDEIRWQENEFMQNWREGKQGG